MILISQWKDVQCETGYLGKNKLSVEIYINIKFIYMQIKYDCFTGNIVETTLKKSSLNHVPC